MNLFFVQAVLLLELLYLTSLLNVNHGPDKYLVCTQIQINSIGQMSVQYSGFESVLRKFNLGVLFGRRRQVGVIIASFVFKEFFDKDFSLFFFEKWPNFSLSLDSAFSYTKQTFIK